MATPTNRTYFTHHCSGVGCTANVSAAGSDFGAAASAATATVADEAAPVSGDATNAGAS